MEKRIELERRARKENQITELNLDNCRSTSIVGLTDEYTALETLSLINVGLTTLKGFPKLPNLKKLELSDNRISNGLNYLTTSPKLQYLNLSGNKIKDLEILSPLKEFKNLAVLDLFNNEATQADNYREKIFQMLPSLKFLDGFDCDDVEAPSDGEDDEEAIGNDSDDDDSDADGEEEEDDENDFDEDVSLSEVYNEDIMDDISEWDGEELDEEEEEGIESDDEDVEDGEKKDESNAGGENASTPAKGKTAAKGGEKKEGGKKSEDGEKAENSNKTAEKAKTAENSNAVENDKVEENANADESPRGKKRKHDG